MNAAPRSPWATARTVIAAAGLGFVAIALGGACLDYAGESFGACPTGGPLKVGSDGGNGTPAATGTSCGTTQTSVPEGGAIGSGSAAP